MSLSPIVEYLLAQRRPAPDSGRIGSPLCFPARWQFLVPLIPPGAILSFTLTPPFGAYIGIKHAATFSNAMNPGTLFWDVSQGGNKFSFGWIEDDWVTHPLSYFIVFSDAEPLYAQLTNTSALNQQFIATQWTILIPTEEDWRLVIKHLDAYSQINTEALAQEANALLQRLVGLKKGGGG